MKRITTYLGFIVLYVLVGCQTTADHSEWGMKTTDPYAEASWIRQGEPIMYNNEAWYPADDVETLLDSEVIYIGAYRNVRFYIAKVDVYPYNRLYTVFGKNQYRYFEPKVKDDTDHSPY